MASLETGEPFFIFINVHAHEIRIKNFATSWKNIKFAAQIVCNKNNDTQI